MKRHLLAGLCVCILSGGAGTSWAYFLDTPHNQSNGIYCYTCHSQSYWWNYTPTGVDDTLRNAICLQCHDAASLSPLKGPDMGMHSSSNSTTAHGTWSTECTQCHDVHSQGQLDWAGINDSELFLAEGVFETGIQDRYFDATDPQGGGYGTTIVGIGSIAGQPGWTDTAKWGAKGGHISADRAADGSRGLVLASNKSNPTETFEIISVTGNVLKVKGDMTSAPQGQYFGVIYGQSLKSALMPNGGSSDLDLRDVKFFKPDLIPNSSGGYVDLTPNTAKPTGLCQVCHTDTSVWQSNGNSGDHYQDTACGICHNVLAGGAQSVDHLAKIVNFRDDANYSYPVDCATCHNVADVTKLHQAATNMAAGATTGCQACHTPDPPALNADVTARIGSTPYPVTCAQCHADKPGQVDNGSHGGHAGSAFAWSGNCADCHSGVNIVRDLHANNCTVCHDPAAVASYNFTILRDGDPLNGIDGDARRQSLTSSCTDCHTSNTSGVIHHISRTGSAASGKCTTCHATSGHQGDHSSSIAGYLNCSRCHAGNVGTTNGAPVDSSDPKQHQSCLTCHNFDSSLKNLAQAEVRGLLTAMPLGGGSCFDCHGEYFIIHISANHTDSVANTSNCAGCHPATAGTDTTIPVNPADNRIHQSCKSCHDPLTGALRSRAPAGAGTTVAMPDGGGDCAACHGEYFVTHRNTNHLASVANTPNCAACHPDTAGTATTVPVNSGDPKLHRSCGSCHNLLSGALLPAYGTATAMQAGGGDCNICHGVYFPKHISANHSTSVTDLGACVVCHTGASGTPTGIPTSAADPMVHTACATCHDADNGALLTTSAANVFGWLQGSMTAGDCGSCHGATYLENHRHSIRGSVEITAPSGNTDESGRQATFQVRLGSQPSATVTIPISSSDTSEGTVDVANLTFTNADWDQFQTVTVTGVSDTIADGNQSYFVQLGAAISSDPYYSALDPDDVAMLNVNVKTGSLSITPISGDTDESGRSATFQVRLNSQPAFGVTLRLYSSDNSEGKVDQASLFFTTSNWNIYQTVTVTGIDDPVADGNQSYSIILGPTYSADDNFDGLDPADLAVTNYDVKTGGFDITKISGDTDESGRTATFQVRLTSQPAFDVTFPVSSSNTGEGTVDHSSLLFTSGNWNQYQTVTVTGIDDPLADGNQPYTIYLGETSSVDDNYQGLDPADVFVINNNVKTGTFTVTTSPGNTDESGRQVTFQLRLNSQPAGDVIIPISSSDTSEGTVDLTRLTFTNATWQQAQTVTVTGIDDNLDDGNQTFSITLGPTSSLDDNYNALTPAAVPMINVDLVDTYGVTPAISAGNAHNLVLANDGSVWGWGQCADGQLDITPAACSTAVILPQPLNISKAAALSAGYGFSAILKKDGTVWTSGANTYSQLGHVSSATLAQVEGLSDVKAISAGAYHVLALKNNSTVWGWGKGAAGQLGNGTYATSQSPVPALGAISGKTITAIAGGQDHSLALDNSGTVYTWGSDGYEQLGTGTGDNTTPTPTGITTLSGVSLIGTGQLHSFALGTVAGLGVDTYGWGYNNSYQLGAGSGNKTVPTGVGTFSSALKPIKIDGGPMHSLALVGNVVYAWGDNDDMVTGGTESWDNRGALGTGAIADKSLPTISFTSSSAMDVEAGYNYSLILQTDGRLKTSGKNAAAQLGTNEIDAGASNYTATPVFVEDPGDLGKGVASTFYAYRPILAGYPAVTTANTTATISVCPNTLLAPANCGPITYYKYSTDNGNNWSTATPIATPINLSGLSSNVQLWVKGMIGSTTEIQTNSSAVKVSWSVQ